MEVKADLAQDVFKDAGESVIFVMLSLKRANPAQEREVIADMADRVRTSRWNGRSSPIWRTASVRFSDR